MTVGDAPPVYTESDADGRFVVKLPLPQLEPGRYDVIAVCGPELHASVDVILVSAQGGAASSSAVLTFFVLIGVGVWQLRRGINPTGMG